MPSLAHELSNSLLWHDPGSVIAGELARVWNAEQEEEAQWLAGALLVSDEAALERRGTSFVDAARFYGTSVDMVRCRFNVTGARKRATAAPT